MFKTVSGAPSELAVCTRIGCELPEPTAATAIPPAVLVPSALSTSIARKPVAAVGLILRFAVISPEFTRVTLTTVTSVACTLPVDALNDASGGEITTVAPTRKFAPTSVIRTWLAPCTGNSGEALVKNGEGTGAATMSVTALDVSGAPVGARLTTETESVPVEAISEAGTVTVNCVALSEAGLNMVPSV